MTFPMECPTKLSLIFRKLPDLEALSIFFLTNEVTSWASLFPISLKSPDVFSSFTSDIRTSTLESIKSHWFRTSRKSRWCPYLCSDEQSSLKYTWKYNVLYEIHEMDFTKISWQLRRINLIDLHSRTPKWSQYSRVKQFQILHTHKGAKGSMY